jgi:hypothetical protein
MPARCSTIVLGVDPVREIGPRLLLFADDYEAGALDRRDDAAGQADAFLEDTTKG